jgi:hypothetical protein
MTKSVTKETVIEIEGDLGMAHNPSDYSDFRAGRPSTTSSQMVQPTRISIFGDGGKNEYSIAQPQHHNNQTLFNQQSFESIQLEDDYTSLVI